MDGLVAAEAGDDRASETEAVLTRDAPPIPPPAALPPAAEPRRQEAFRVIDRLMAFCGVDGREDQ